MSRVSLNFDSIHSNLKIPFLQIRMKILMQLILENIRSGDAAIV